MQSSPGADQAESTRLRLTFLTLLVVSLFVVLFARLWFLQVMAGERYAGLAQGNAIRTISIEAPRGKILDRDGEAIVRNRYANVVSVKPDDMGERRDEVMADVADLLGMTVAEIDQRLERSRVHPFRPKPIAFDVPGDIRDYIHENAPTRYPGVYAETLPLREYSNGSLAAHVVGYLGEISAEELDKPEYAGYRPGDLIGWAGVERVYERSLRGIEGQRRYIVNARGRVIGSLEEQLPVPGADLHLAVDVEVQRVAEGALRDGLEMARRVRDVARGPGRGGTFRATAGAVVVLDPSNGEVLALASYPAFEPERFVGGVSHDYWNWLNDRDSAFPLLNRAVQSSHPPGSVYKVIPTAAALEAGYMTTRMRLPCPARWEFGGNVFRNWRTRDMPAMNLAEALEDSCDPVYYEIARRMWADEQEAARAGRAFTEHLTEQSKAWGLGAPTGIDLPGERSGVVPGREWKRAFWERHRENYCTQALEFSEGSHAQAVYADLCEYGGRWRGGDAVNLSIGQGDLQSTPVQVANTFAAIANRGTLYRPRVVRAVAHPDGRVEQFEPEVIGTLPVSREHLDYIERGLVGVTRGEGTAGSVFDGFPVTVAGKTGTAEFKPKQPFAWFAAYAPVEAPRYVVVVMVEEGGSGSQVAAPIVKRIYAELFGVGGAETLVPGARTE